MKHIIYSKFSNDRATEFSIVTDIVADGEKKYVVKKANSDQSQPHINAIYQWHQLLKEQFQSTKLSLAPCVLEDGKVIYEYVQGKSLEAMIDQCLLDDDKMQAIRLIEEYFNLIRERMSTKPFAVTEQFKAVFGDVELPENYKAARVSDIDMVLDNVVVQNDRWYLIDYEWTFDFPIPVEYVLFRILFYYIRKSPIRQCMKDYYESCFSEKERQIFEQMEYHFQEYVKGDTVPLRDLYSGGIGKLQTEAIPVVQSVRKLMAIYKDCGEGYSEAAIQYQTLINNRENHYGIDIDVNVDAVAYRIDPTEDSCILADIHVMDEKGIEMEYTVKGTLYGGSIYVCPDDPWIEVVLKDNHTQKISLSFIMLTACKEISDYIEIENAHKLEQEKQHVRLVKKIEELKAANSNLEQANAELEHAVNELRTVNQTILNSTSWKVSKPIRSAGTAARKALESNQTVYKACKNLRTHMNPDVKVDEGRDPLEYRIDVLQKLTSGYAIHGWAVSEHPVKIKVFDRDHHEVEAKINRVTRYDVNQAYGLSDDEQTGFLIFIDVKNCHTNEFIVCFKSQDHRKVFHAKLREFKDNDAIFAGKKDVLTKDNAVKVMHYLKSYGIKPTAAKVKQHILGKQQYNAWAKGQIASKQLLEAQKQHVFAYQPKISIVIPLYNTPKQYLKEIIDSVVGQSYQNWQLCLADASTQPEVGEYVQKYYGKEHRIVYRKLKTNGGISDNTNEAIAFADGDFVMFSDHDDIIEKNALFEIVNTINAHPDADMIYTDEDKITMDGKNYFEPHFKPDFNLDMLRSNNYICHITVVRRSLLDAVGGLRKAYDGAQDYDFVLRCSIKTEHIYHIPKVLYHWRCHPDSTAANPESKRYAFDAGQHALEDYYRTLGIKAKVECRDVLGWYKTIYELECEPLISVIIPNKDHCDDLDKCLKSIYAKTTYKNFEIIIVENNSTEEETFKYYEEAEKQYDHLTILTWKDEFNYSAINNFAVQRAKGEYVLFLNNDIEVISPDWMTDMLRYAQRKDVGIVGAKLYYPDNTIQHAGVIMGLGGVAGHIFSGIPRNDYGYGGLAMIVQDMSAVTAACMLMKKSDFESVGGFDEGYKVAFNDVDLCMKIREKDLLIVYTPDVEMFHYESKSRGQEDSSEKLLRFQGEVERFKKRWPEILRDGDPYYNVNLTLKNGNCTLRAFD